MKDQFRKSFLALRAALSAESRREQSRGVEERLRALPLFRSSRIVLGYAALPDEVDVSSVLREAVISGKRVGLPRLGRDGLTPLEWDLSVPLEKGRFGILEPPASASEIPAEEIEVVLVPGVAFDARGHRLGFGKGYYDRFLPSCPNAETVGLAFDVQFVDELPTTGTDVQMDWLLVPGTTRHFAR